MNLNASFVPYGWDDRSLAGADLTGEERMKNAAQESVPHGSLIERRFAFAQGTSIKGSRTAFSIVPFLGLHPV